MATAVFTTVEARVDQGLTNAIWKDEIQDNLNALAGSHRNLLTNGGFEQWQRGAGAFTTTLAYTADRWQMTVSGGTTTVTKETSTVDGASAASLKAVVTAGGVGSITQKIEDHIQLRGKTVAVSMRVHQSVASGATLSINSSSGSSAGATSATTGAWVTLTATYTLGASDTSLSIGVQMNPGTYYLDNAMLVIGPAPAPYQPLHPQEDLARCQRYYEVHGGATGMPFFNAYGAAGAVGGASVQCAVTKGGTPTVTKNGTWQVANCGQPVVGSPTPGGYALSTTITALGTYSYNPNSADDTVTIEWNP